jgi:hypothetical protein
MPHYHYQMIKATTSPTKRHRATPYLDKVYRQKLPATEKIFSFWYLAAIIY